MTQWAEIRHLHLVEGVSKKQIARRLQLDIKTVRRAVEQPTPPVRAVLAAGAQPGPVAGADRAVAGPGPAGDGEADSAVAVAVGRPGRRAHGAPVCGGTKSGHVAEGGLRAPQRASWDDDGGRLRRIVGRGRGNAAEASSTWWRRCPTPTCISPRRIRSSGSSRCSTGSSRRSRISAALSTGWCSTTRRRSRRCWPAGTGLRPRRSTAFRGAYPFRAEFCAPAKGWEKGSVETGVKYVRNLVFRPRAATESWAALNALLITELEADLPTRHLDDGRSVQAAWMLERKHLRALPVHLPATCRVVARVADKFGHVRVDHETYSVLESATPTGRCG